MSAAGATDSGEGQLDAELAPLGVLLAAGCFCVAIDEFARTDPEAALPTFAANGAVKRDAGSGG